MAGPTLLVTGAGSGIGAATARLAAGRGWQVVLVDRDGDAVGRLAARIADGGGDAEAAALDVTDADGVAELFASLGRRGRVPTGVVAAAGVDLGGPSHQLPVERWQRVLDVNLTGAFLVCREAVAALLAAGSPGALVLCSSPAAFAGFAAGGGAAYAASKGGVSALVRSLAVDYARSGIRVNAVVPGPTDTPLMWAGVAQGGREAAEARIRDEVPLGRLADPSEPARAALWLLSDDAAYVTGAHLVCDGGVLAKASISF